jgi:hypothetical protein
MQRSIGELAAKTDRLIADVKSQGDKIDRVRLHSRVGGWRRGSYWYHNWSGYSDSRKNVARDTRRSPLISNGTTTVKLILSLDLLSTRLCARSLPWQALHGLVPDLARPRSAASKRR